MYQSKVILTLHSNDASVLFNGGKKGAPEFIPGFFYSQKRLNLLYNEGLSNNPYAETALLDIQFSLEEIKVFCNVLNGQIEGKMNRSSKDGITVVMLESSNPKTIEINYVTEFATLFVKMMAQSDRAFLHIRTAYTAGLIEEQYAKEQMWTIRKKVRNVFQKAVSYQKKITVGITREDIVNETPAALEMKKVFGLPHENVMSSDVTFGQRRLNLLAG
jgi:hypothetical protein